jgi:uncharacterized protein (DUF2235 family)
MTNSVGGRRIVICLDGTKNEPEAGATNVARIYDLATKSEEQVAYYDPGVGTMGARSAITGIGKTLTRIAGLIMGFGIRENIEEAYGFLMHTYQPGDRIYIFGFSRGAYSARALVGMLRTIGLLRPGADNLIPYALKLYAKSGKKNQSEEQEKKFWQMRDDFSAQFGNPDFPNRFVHQIQFLGVWDTVKSVGWLNWRAKFQQARWPFTRKVPNVAIGRHAISIDERRRPYPEYRFDPKQIALHKADLREMWFAGVHSDVGGQFPDDHRLSDIAFKWMADEAIAAGLSIDAKRYHALLNVKPEEDLPDDYALGAIHANSFGWFLLGAGWHHRKIQPGDAVHPSVLRRVALTAELPKSKQYRPPLPKPKS